MKYLILFDIDGTIQNFKTQLARDMFAEVLEDIFGKPIPAYAIPNFAGMTDLQILFDICSAINYPKADLMNHIELIWDNMYNHFKAVSTKENIILLPGIYELISAIKAEDIFCTALITGNFKRNAYLKLSAHNLAEHFAFGAFGDDHNDRNQLPLIAIKRANELIAKGEFSYKNTLIIGDTLRDIECAKINNIPVLSVATGSYSIDELEKHNPDILMQNLADTGEVISSIKRVLKIQ